MSRVTANGIQIEYETFGSPSGRPLLLIMGLGGHMIVWGDDLCKDLADRGHYVVRYDNRDVGLSTKFEEAGMPNLIEIIEKVMRNETARPSYTLDDMANDGVGLLTALGIQKAHICGMSMGGMIAQTIAIRHPSRVLSLISISSNTGNRELPQPKPEVTGLFYTPPPKERAGYIEHTVRRFKAVNGPGYPIDEKWSSKIFGDCYDRCFYPQGNARQYAAMITQSNREPALASVNVPTLVVHGTSDPLFPVEWGKATAKAIPGAQLMLIEGMGHDLPHGGAWQQIDEAITIHTQKATL
jgi:pimeloyl-ACP methyl ester carboxylesterase